MAFGRLSARSTSLWLIRCHMSGSSSVAVGLNSVGVRQGSFRSARRVHAITINSPAVTLAVLPSPHF
jgi:hypothetical protein